jgi:hypothetical protein
MSKKITVEEKIHMPAMTAPRTFTWIVSILAAPFTGGASLVVGPTIFALGERAERKHAASEIGRMVPHDLDAELINEQIARGHKRARVSTHVDLGHLGLGTVTRETAYNLEEPD